MTDYYKVDVHNSHWNHCTVKDHLASQLKKGDKEKNLLNPHYKSFKG